MLNYFCKKKLLFYIFGLIIISAKQVQGQQPNLQTFWFYEDTTKSYTIASIQQDSTIFREVVNKSLVYNITNSAIWIKFKLTKREANLTSFFLELSTPTIHYIDFFHPIDSSCYSVISTGFLKDYYSRGILSDHFIFPIRPESNWYYLRLESGHFLNADLRIATLSEISSNGNNRHLFYGLYGGILLVIVLIVSVTALQSRQYHFLFYVGFIFFGSTITFLESGLYFEAIWPQTPIFNYLFPLYTFGVSFSILFFLRYAFKANEMASKLYYFNFWILSVLPIFPVIYFLSTDNYTLALVVVQISSMLISFLVLLMTLICFFKGKEFKPYYRLIVTGQILMVLSIAIYLAAQNQLINLGFIRDFVIMIGGVGEAVCFTMAIFTYQNSTIKKYHGLLRKQNETLQTAVDLRTKELEYKNKDLVVAMQEKDSLLNIVAHDLKSPLNQTKALGNLLLHHTRDEKAMKEMLKRIDQAADHGIRLIEELITISKLEQQKDEIKLEGINLSDLLNPMVRNFEIIASHKNVKINAVIEESIYIKSYPVYLIRIVENLLSNAIKFSAPNTKIDFIVDDCCIVIRDYGPGFSNDDLEKVFGKFQRLSARPTAGESSTGLGLYIVKLLTDKLNMRVELTSEPGRGSSFILRF